MWEKSLEDIRAVHLHPKDIGGAIVSVDQPLPAASWRWGGPGWRVQDGARAAQRVLGVTIEADDPRAMAMRWAGVLGLAAPAAEGIGQRLALDGGRVDFVPAGARGEGIAGFTLKVADRAAVQQAALAGGVPVRGEALAAFGARIELLV